MAATHTLTRAERDFLRRLDDFVFGNPFGAPRERVLAELIPGTPLPALLKDPGALPKVVTDSMPRFDRNRRARVGDFGAEDQVLVETACIYLAYHRYLADFDRLIDQQLSNPTNAQVAFGAPMIAELTDRGIDEPKALRYAGFFYQLRRAFYFIEGLRMIVGESPSMRQLRMQLWNSVFTHDMRNYRDRLWNRMEDFSTLLLGETGTGKGNAAAVIGRSAFIPFIAHERRYATNFAQTFISLNLSQFPETLIESELFGHRKGAFTGAIENHEGVLELCSEHGALFLDEIGEVSVPIQIKLLRVLQDRAFTPLGSHAEKRFKGRVIAATNRPVEELRRERGFRDDFFYRLCSDVIVLPPLRQRIEESPAELELLVGPLLTRMTGTANETGRVLEALKRDLPAGYSWPGNVRELEQAVRRILLTGRYSGSFANAAPADEGDDLAQRIRAGSLSAEEMLERYCTLLYRRHGTYEEVARRAGLDRRTVKKYADAAGK